MSHHLDSPLARQDIRLDITDLYVFRGEIGTVFVINVCHSIFGNDPRSGLSPRRHVRIQVDLDGDAIENVTYRITFDERDGRAGSVSRSAASMARSGRSPRGGRRDRVEGVDRRDRRRPERPAGVGRQGGRSVLDRAGRSSRRRPCVPGRRHDRLWGWDPAKAKNLFAGHTVYSIVLEVPDAELSAGGNAADRRVGRCDAGDRCGRLAFNQSRRPADDPSAVHAVQ